MMQTPTVVFESNFFSFVELEGVPGSASWLRSRTELDVTGADAAKAVGCSEYESAENFTEHKRYERICSDEQLLKASEDFKNVHTIAGQLNEDPIASGVSRHLFHDAPLYAPRLCVPIAPHRFGATPDRLVCSVDHGVLLLRRPLVAIECKFSFDGVQEYPLVDHIFQVTLSFFFETNSFLFLYR